MAFFIHRNPLQSGKFDSEMLEEKRLKQEKENKRKSRKKIIPHLLKINTDSLTITYQPSYFDTDFHIVNVKKKGIEKTFQGLVNSDNVFIIPPNYERIEQHLYNANLFELIDFEGSNSLYDIATKKIMVSNFDFIKTHKISHTQKKESQYIYATTVDSLEIIFNSNLEPIWNSSSTNKHPKEGLSYMDIDSRKPAQYGVNQAKFTNIKKYKKGEFLPQLIENNLNKQLNFPESKISIIIDTTSIDTFNHKYWGYNIYVANTTNHSSVFTTQEGKLYLKTQAKDKNGKWCDIEYLPNTRYGHHFSENTLPSNDYWVFTIPIYQGIQKTEMRMVLMTSKKGNFGWQIETDESKWIYSESFEGYINPAQLWRFPESWSLYH